MSNTNLRLEIDRNDLAHTRLVEESLGELAAGSVRFDIERFAVTANTLTYATFGDMLGYWNFYPVESGWGAVPAMGWATVSESAHPEIEPGGRYYGWFPMARSVDVHAAPVADGIRDDGSHRAEHAPVYRTFTRTDSDYLYQAGEDAEDRHALLRGLFATGFLADDFFADNKDFGASRVLVLSASSKTAIAFASCASLRDGVEVVALTSPTRREFVASLPCYDSVLAYDDVESLATEADTILIDMAGNGAVLERVHRHLGDRLRYSMAVGRSHHDAPETSGELAGPQPEFFFAPTQVEKRIADWGADDYRNRLGASLRGFVDQSSRWLEVVRSVGPEAAAEAWADLLAGTIEPNIGRIASIGKGDESVS